MNTKLCKIAFNTFKSLIIILSVIISASGCEKDDEAVVKVVDFSKDSIFVSYAVIPRSENSFVSGVTIKKQYISSVSSYGFEYSFTPDFKIKDSVNIGISYLDRYGYNSQDLIINLQLSDLFLNKTYYIRAFAKLSNSGNANYSRISEFTTFNPTIEKGPKFLIGYNDSLFTANLDGSNFKFFSVGRNLSKDGKVVQIGNNRLQNISSNKIIRDYKVDYGTSINEKDNMLKVFSSYDYNIIKDFSDDGSMYIFYNRYLNSAVYKNDTIITVLVGANGYSDKVIENFSKDCTKVVYEKGWGNISVFDLSNNTSISVDNWGVGEINKFNTKVVFSTGGYSYYGGGLFWMSGSLKICNSIENGGANSTTLITYDSQSTNNLLKTTHPIFSDDENIIYFLGRTPGNGWDIYSIPVSGGTPTKITNQPIDFTKVSGSVLFKLVNFE